MSAPWSTATDVGLADVAPWVPHPLHAPDRAWPESNCYLDLWIALLHAKGLEPLAMLGPAAAVDFEGDQWRFCKPSMRAIRELYGIELCELQLYRDLESHVAAQARRDVAVLVEVDAHWLPDTTGTTYRAGHQKTTIATWRIDRVHERLRYLHNGGMHTLEGEDYRGLFTTAREGLPPYAEFVRFDLVRALPHDVLAATAMRLLVDEMRHRTNADAMMRFRASLEDELEWVARHDLEHFHQWAFATVRQLGSAAGLTEAHLAWLGAAGYGVGRAAPIFGELSAAAKVLQFRLARVPAGGRVPDVTLLLRAVTQAWHSAMRTLDDVADG
ncbi:MAG: DUF1839 family protein [Gemmatimonadaceae bacterium]|nr:DUF1839 family protein [Gemmatimonadaceae bacterium]